MAGSVSGLGFRVSTHTLAHAGMAGFRVLGLRGFRGFRVSTHDNPSCTETSRTGEPSISNVVGKDILRPRG